MLRFKVLTESILLVISLFALTARDTNPAFEPGSSDITLPERHEESMQVQKVNFYGTEELKVLREAIESYFEKAIASGDIVGAGVSIVVGDEVLLADGFGKRNWRTANKVDGQTLFRLGSLSKGFAGILAADLTNEGLISWEDRVSDCLPEFQLGNRTNTGKI
ncbi:MAG: serine hydrolase, partial [Robiginitalea sp.]